LTSATDDWDELVLVGIVARTHGNKGEVIVNSHTDFPEARFQPGAVVQTQMGGARRALRVASARLHKGRPVLAIDGFSSISDAEALAGCELRVSPAVQHPLPDGVYYHSDLIGCEVVDAAGAPVGRVTKVEGEMGQSRLIVTGPRRVMTIPLAQAICQVDMATRRIVVTPPDGLLEL
jgi:16S rRNA processing protein RimM